MRLLCLSVAPLLAALLAAGPALANNLDKLRQELARANDPVNRAKATAKLGDALVKQMTELYKKGAYTDGEQLLDEYLTAVRAAHRGLKESGRDARRKPAGFKQLEIHLRQSGQSLERIAQHAPLDSRDPLVQAQKELADIRSELLQALMEGKAKPRPDI